MHVDAPLDLSNRSFPVVYEQLYNPILTTNDAPNQITFVQGKSNPLMNDVMNQRITHVIANGTLYTVSFVKEGVDDFVLQFENASPSVNSFVKSSNSSSNKPAFDSNLINYAYIIGYSLS
jgi:hypothetical protein